MDSSSQQTPRDLYSFQLVWKVNGDWNDFCFWLESLLCGISLPTTKDCLVLGNRKSQFGTSQQSISFCLPTPHLKFRGIIFQGSSNIQVGVGLNCSLFIHAYMLLYVS